MTNARDLPIETVLIDDHVVLRIQGAELFDAIDDYMNSLLDAVPQVRMPGAGSGIHELIFPAIVTSTEVQEAISRMPMDELIFANAVDNQSTEK